MKITKHTHANLTIEQDGQKLVIDPGSFSTDLGNVEHVVAIVVTHSHPDHLNTTNLQAILAASPDAKVFGTPEVADAFPEATIVGNGEQIDIGPFSLAFFGHDHATIHASVPVPHNIGVLVNNLLFYPGDAFTVPTQPVHILAAPGNAPWARVGETMDYIAAVKPAVCFPTHNGLLSKVGHRVYNGALELACKNSGTEFRYLAVGDSIDL